MAQICACFPSLALRMVQYLCANGTYVRMFKYSKCTNVFLFGTYHFCFLIFVDCVRLLCHEKFWSFGSTIWRKREKKMLGWFTPNMVSLGCMCVCCVRIRIECALRSIGYARTYLRHVQSSRSFVHRICIPGLTNVCVFISAKNDVSRSISCHFHEMNAHFQYWLGQMDIHVFKVH